MPLWPDGCRRNWRCLQPIRLPRDFIAVVIRAHRPWFGPTGVDRCIPVPCDGNDRRDVHRDRGRAVVSGNGHAEYGRHRKPFAGGGLHQPNGYCGVCLYGHRRRAKDRHFPAPPVASERLHVRSEHRFRIPCRDGDKSFCLYSAALRLLRVRRGVFVRVTADGDTIARACCARDVPAIDRCLFPDKR